MPASPATATAPTAPDPTPAPAPPAIAEPTPKPQLPVAQPETEAPPRGLEEVDQSDMVIPRFGIVQPTSEHGKAGMIRDQVSGEEHKALEGVVLLKVRKGRVYFADPEDGGELVCASDDRIYPAERIDQPVSESCAGCPSSEWKDTSGRRTPPDCGETYTFLLAHDGMPYFMTYKSGAIKDVKKLLTQLSLKCRKEKLDVFGFQFTIGTAEVKFDVGKAFMPRFTLLKKVSKADYELYGALFDSFAHQEPVFDDAPKDGEDGAGGGDGQGDFPFGPDTDPSADTE